MHYLLHVGVPLLIVVALIILFGMLSTSEDQELKDAIAEIDLSLKFNNNFEKPEEVITLELFGYDFPEEDQEKILKHYRKQGYKL